MSSYIDDNGVSWTVGTDDFDSSGDNTIISAPGEGRRLRVKYLVVQNVSTTDTTALIKWGSSTEHDFLLAGKLGVTIVGDLGNEWRLPANTALIVNLSGGNAHKANFQYTIEKA